MGSYVVKCRCGKTHPVPARCGTPTFDPHGVCGGKGCRVNETAADRRRLVEAPP